MSKIEMVKFKPWHLFEIVKDSVEESGFSPDWAYGVAKFPSWTGMCEGRPIGCGGVIILWPGVAEAWSCFPKSRQKHKRDWFVYTKRFLDKAIDEHDLFRVQAHYRMDMAGAKEALENFQSGKKAKPCNWMEHLGFKCEGLMRKFESDGTDALLYARVI